MVKITIVDTGGAAKCFDAAIGQSLMEAATKAGITGIVGECGGNCVCGTCRFYPAPEWQDLLAPKSAIEVDMLDFIQDPRPEARLACRIMVTDRLDGLVAGVPDSQYPA